MSRGSLQDIIEAKGPLSEEVLASVAKQVLLGLHHLHAAHTVHRDIKPANILVSLRGQVKITDFGILAELSQTQVSHLVQPFAATARH
jgi:serine/threonine protein kinase